MFIQYRHNQFINLKKCDLVEILYDIENQFKGIRFTCGNSTISIDTLPVDISIIDEFIVLLKSVL